MASASTPGGAHRREVPPRRREVERTDDLAARPDALVDLDHRLVEQRRQLDPPHEQARPVLVADAQRVAEAPGDDQRRALALALQQRVGCHRRAHLHRLDRRRGHPLADAETEQRTDALDRGVAVALRVLGQQLAGDEPAVRAPGDDVGERAAAVDPELPALAIGAGGTRVGHGMFRWKWSEGRLRNAWPDRTGRSQLW